MHSASAVCPASAAAPADKLPVCLRHCQVGELGRGSFAQTKLFTEERTGERVAVKLIDRGQVGALFAGAVCRPSAALLVGGPACAATACQDSSCVRACRHLLHWPASWPACPAQPVTRANPIKQPVVHLPAGQLLSCLLPLTALQYSIFLQLAATSQSAREFRFPRTSTQWMCNSDGMHHSP